MQIYAYHFVNVNKMVTPHYQEPCQAIVSWCVSHFMLSAMLVGWLSQCLLLCLWCFRIRKKMFLKISAVHGTTVPTICPSHGSTSHTQYRCPVTIHILGTIVPLTHDYEKNANWLARDDIRDRVLPVKYPHPPSASRQTRCMVYSCLHSHRMYMWPPRHHRQRHIPRR